VPRPFSSNDDEEAMTRIFVPQPIPEAALARLETLGDVTIHRHVDRLMPYDEMMEAVRDQDVFFALGEIPYDARLIDAAANLELIAAMHGAAKFVDIAAATRRGIPVTGLPYDMILKTTAEFTFALLLATAWRLPEADAFLRGGRWKQNQSMAFMGTRLFGKTLGIAGMGNVGQMVARRAAACEMRIAYFDRARLSPAEAYAFGGAEFRSIEDLFIESDFVALTLPLTKETRGLVDARLLALMKPEAILINTARGELVDEAALEAALREGRIRGCGLDVYHNEVPDPDPGPPAGLRDLPNVVLTPHIGSGARETREEMALRTVRNIERFLAGERPFNVLNPEVYGEAAIASDRIS
jgi:phosphoglycerate dehydrogenase-like enzyme